LYGHKARAENLDFTNAGGGSCAVGTAYAAGATCTVKVAFSPQFIGPRYGAVVLLDSTAAANPIGTVYLQATGQGPELTYPPIVQVDLGPVPIYPTTDFQSNSSDGGLAFDGNGNIYVASASYLGQRNYPASFGVTKWTLSNGSYTQTAISPTGGPGIAVDGAGSLFFACGTTVCKGQPLPNGSYAISNVASGFYAVYGVAVDGSGNVYVADDFAVYLETLQTDGTYLQSPIGSGWQTPFGIALDGSGDLYVGDSTIFEETPAGGSYTQSTVASNVSYYGGTPSVAVDLAGDVYAVTGGLYYYYIGLGCSQNFLGPTPVLEETPQSGGGYLQTTFGGFTDPNVVALDGSGNLYVVDTWDICSQNYGELYEYQQNFTKPPSLAFGSVLVGQASRTQTVTLSNSGDMPMTFSQIAYPTDFPEASGVAGDCSVSAPVPPGGTCTLTILFKPITGTGGSLSVPFSEQVTFTTNSLVSPQQQTIPVSGTEIVPTTAAPGFVQPGGVYPAALSVSLSDATTGATIYYTTDGSQPTTSSAVFTTAIPVPATLTVAAIATYPGYFTSPTARSTYLIQQQAAAPVFNPPAGSYPNPQLIAIADSSPGTAIYYTLDGTAPTTSSTKYTAPISIRNSRTITAMSVGLPAYTASPAVVAAINLTAATPVLNPPGGSFTSPTNVTMTTGTVAASIWYTTNGSTPSIHSTKYTGPVAVGSTETVKAIAIATGYTSGPVESQTYTFLSPAPTPAPTPTFSPIAGSYNNTQTVTLMDAASGASYYYTLNGETPDPRRPPGTPDRSESGTPTRYR
jgi:hypothetical protein